MRVILSTSPEDIAQSLADQLVGEGLASCVQVLPGGTSTYRWQGEIHRDQEALLILKVAAKQVNQLRARFLELHPYEVPEFIALEPQGSESNPAYLRWVKSLANSV